MEVTSVPRLWVSVNRTGGAEIISAFGSRVCGAAAIERAAALRLHVSHSSRLGNFLEAAGPLFDAPFADGLLHTLPSSEVEQGIWRAQTRVYHFNAAVGAWEVGCQLNNHGSHHCDSLTVRIVGSPSTRSLSAVHTCRVAGS